VFHAYLKMLREVEGWFRWTVYRKKTSLAAMCHTVTEVS